ncbi:TPA: urea ABC transporter permease subunit UrtB [Pseudomonas aeruginosa]|uniref:urea ABC transporter permease subunit UrtB n=1 Tax=Pseudomonas aeruginosa TaxID=287 RepID=UPI000FC3FA32|nr:urea ABC transporter permease subunit UrtB [Pseudomonas aeruginosa]EKB8023985.1 urea ABC transporter permease subunit UrtB [Pseudomonas aeruginosa]EKT7962619.1 urea ABC transporter permease subunit UrtB [Pseudomonas aeruginosa]RUB86613.1 urea ABC transporter permease subunit UrtB [Pseudomonas aeruginosa]HCE6814726.1 urea ABC transporter permease subunit UrtB [Pseudomonas aeruginosa]HCK4589642.1 urea ABC transporter permease subunit UrtB [Pseudomonas aeruginosa]
MPLALLTRPLHACVLVLAALLAVTAYAGPAQDFAAADNGGRAHLLEHWAATPDADRLAFLEALRHNRIALDSRQQPFILGADQRFQAAEGDALPDGEPKPLRLNNRLRGLLNTALASHQLVANEVPLRQAAAQQLQKTAKAAQRPLLEARLRIESDAGVKEALGLALANLQLGDPDPALRLSAVRLLGESGDPLARTRLENLLDPAVEPEEGVRIAAATSLAQIKRRLLVGDLLGQAFSGLSLGSILLLAALGLAITYGLLGVINMAHGEMLMLGAYSTYVVQLLFQRLAPEWLALYPLLALPVAFCVSAAIGMALERTVIRHLYGRPLETLLATWGISLVLIQLVRMLFGAQNVEVANPAWLSGGIQVLPNLVLPWNRIVIIGFALFVLLLTWLLLNRTRLGLNVRAVTQNRNMAACCGVPTGRVDMLAFGLGSGIAGLGGVALSQVGNVGPDLGQGYIIDSFLVVVLGGVGQLAGSVLAAFGLGVANKILEPQIGAVLGKILILALIVLFIQKRPQGLFALKGRVID